MNNTHGLTKENMLRALPDVLKNDARMAAIAEAIAGALVNCVRDTDKLLIYPDIDNLPEELLDILAYDFKVDWWDYSYTLREKIQTLKDSWIVHRRLGTRWAVKTAIAAIYPEVQINEWFEYGGKPYHFRMSIDDANRQITPERHIRLLQLTEYYKNLRSHLEIIEYHSVHDPAQSGVFVGGVSARFSRRKFREAMPDRNVSCDVYIGGGMAYKLSCSAFREATPDRNVSCDIYAGGSTTCKLSHSAFREAQPERRDSTSIAASGSVTGGISRIAHKAATRSFTAPVYPVAGQGYKLSRITINAPKEGL